LHRSRCTEEYFKWVGGGKASAADLRAGHMTGARAARALDPSRRVPPPGPSALGADVLVLVDGDRVTARSWPRAPAASGSRPLRLLIVPREKIERIRRDNGTEEVLTRGRSSLLPAPPPPPLRLVS